MRIGSIACVLGSLISAVIPGDIQAQAAGKEVVLTTPTCQTCKVAVEKVGQLGGDGGEMDDARGLLSISALADGSLAVIPWGPGEVWLVSRQGKVIRRMGRGGEGPGEFKNPAFVAPTPKGDSLYIYDKLLGRVSIFSLSGAFSRAFRVAPNMLTILMLGPTTVIGSGRYSAEDPAVRARNSVFALHFFRGDSLQKSFGEVIKEIDPRNGNQFQRELIPFKGGFLVVPRSGHYAIDTWNADGSSLIGRMVREPTWFPRSNKFSTGSIDEPSTPYISGAWIDASDRLWVISNRALPTWKSAYASTPVIIEGIARRPVTNRELLAQSVVEVFDLGKRTLIYSGPLPFEGPYILGRGMVGVLRETAKNNRTVDLFQLTLKP